MNRLCVLIPVFNNQSGLDRTCASLTDAHGEFDVLIVDDGSAVPIAIPEGLAARRQVNLYRMVRNGGITRALNEGLRLCREMGYVYIGRVDSSDTVDPARFQKQAEHLDANARCGIVGSFIQFVQMDGKPVFAYHTPLTHSAIRRRMYSENCLIHSGVTMRASIVEQVGGYRPSCKTSEDYDLFLRMLLAGEAAVLPFYMTRCEYNLTGISVSRRRTQQKERLYLQLRYFHFFEFAAYYGLARTLLAMLIPHGPVLRCKRILFGVPRQAEAA